MSLADFYSRIFPTIRPCVKFCRLSAVCFMCSGHKIVVLFRNLVEFPYNVVRKSDQISPQAQQWFAMVDRDRTGKINSAELQAALINGHGENFSDNACKLMISMFDRDVSGTIDVYEFEKLFNYINQWLQIFKTYDRNGSGYIDENELTQALTQMGFRFTPEFIQYLVKKNDPRGQKEVSIDQFIVFFVQIQRFTEAFRQRDTEQTGVITTFYFKF